MARMIGVFTQIKGKIGNLIYSTWHGVQVVKTMFIPENPQSSDQQEHRAILTLLVTIGKGILKDIINVSWSPFRRGAQTGWSNWLGNNLILQQGSTLDYDKLCLSDGSIAPTPIKSAQFNSSTGIASIQWDKTIINNQSKSDIPVAFMINESTDLFYYNADLDLDREDESIEITGNIGDTPSDLHGYLWFLSFDNGVIINSSACSVDTLTAP
ncbi:MAG: hypothetical protein DRP08_01140 [Candidatus Aenigmatarchaeota archaeon]|nr:MAG: hypothetical protein DRP08_01140 [Candidatus Aenigmarchaeota archaeon]